MEERIYKTERKTYETDIVLQVNLDGRGAYRVETGIGFFDHMLAQVAKHGFLDLELVAEGDLEVDDHHTVEDVGIVIGKALGEALGSKKGIKRYATVFTPMDEALSMVSMDLSGRAFLHYEVDYKSDRVGSFEVQLVEEFFRALAFHSGLTLHIKNLYGKNDHHRIESIFKAFGRALNEATRYDERLEGPLSTKGLL